MVLFDVVSLMAFGVVYIVILRVMDAYVRTEN